MRLDLYVKTILTIIAIALVVIALQPVGVHAQSSTPSSLRAPFTGLTFQADGTGFMVFDPRTGDLWSYYAITDTPTHYKIVEVGKKVVTQK